MLNCVYNHTPAFITIHLHLTWLVMLTQQVLVKCDQLCCIRCQVQFYACIMIQAVSAQSIGLLGIPESVESKRTFTNLSSNLVEIHNLLKYHNQIINLWSLSFKLRTFGYPTSSKYIQFYSMFFLRKARRISFGRRGKTHLSRQVDIQVQCHRTHTALCAWPCRIK